MNGERLPEGYYLSNFLTVLADAEARYGGLLTEEERATLNQFRSLSLGAQRLYVRMLTRRGPWFRRDGLRYAEIGDPDACLGELLEAGFCEAEPGLTDLLPLLARADLLEALAELAAPAPKGARRDALLERLLQAREEAELVAFLTARLRPVRTRHEVLWRRIFLLFFGNFEQDLATFVVADTGRVRFESYRVDPCLRLFESRADVDYLLSIRELRERLEAVADAPELEALTQAALAMEAHAGVRQQRRFQGLLNALGHAWERAKDLDRALACYDPSERPPARERRTRILAKQGELGAACRLAMDMAEAPRDVGEASFARAFLERQRKKLPGLEPWLLAHPKEVSIPELPHCVPRHPLGVEAAALEAARAEGWNGFFAENQLWRACFGLLLWDELFLDVPGAFHHRFQTAPLDIGVPSFRLNRSPQVEARLGVIATCSDLQSLVLDVADRKWGVANAFVNWRHLERNHLEEAFRRIEPAVFQNVLSAMLQNPLAFDSGFPDLFLYEPGSSKWKLWEVKGPGDTIRAEQAWWLQQFKRWGCEARVVRVSYRGGLPG